MLQQDKHLDEDGGVSDTLTRQEDVILAMHNRAINLYSNGAATQSPRWVQQSMKYSQLLMNQIYPAPAACTCTSAAIWRVRWYECSMNERHCFHKANGSAQLGMLAITEWCNIK